MAPSKMFKFEPAAQHVGAAVAAAALGREEALILPAPGMVADFPTFSAQHPFPFVLQAYVLEQNEQGSAPILKERRQVHPHSKVPKKRPGWQPSKARKHTKSSSPSAASAPLPMTMPPLITASATFACGQSRHSDNSTRRRKPGRRSDAARAAVQKAEPRVTGLDAEMLAKCGIDAATPRNHKFTEEQIFHMAMASGGERNEDLWWTLKFGLSTSTTSGPVKTFCKQFVPEDALPFGWRTKVQLQRVTGKKEKAGGTKYSHVELLAHARQTLDDPAMKVEDAAEAACARMTENREELLSLTRALFHEGSSWGGNMHTAIGLQLEQEVFDELFKTANTPGAAWWQTGFWRQHGLTIGGATPDMTLMRTGEFIVARVAEVMIVCCLPRCPSCLPHCLAACACCSAACENAPRAPRGCCLGALPRRG